MKKRTLRSVFDGLRSSVAQQPKNEHEEIVENLRSENFQLVKTFRHGFPYQPTAIAFDPIQKLLAIGSKTGSLRLLGRPGVDAHVRHETDAAVIQMQFLTNEGALITATADDSLHLWNFRQKRPEIVHSLKFQRERITYIHLPLQSKWLYVGTEKGNVHVVNIESFTLSGYIINWNKAIDVCMKTHPGPIMHLSDNPLEASKLLLAYETGLVVLWDLRLKKAEFRWQCTEPIKSICWHYEGKQFLCSHTDGTISTWAVRPMTKPLSVNQPHMKTNKDGKLEQCKPIQKVEWKHSRSGEGFVIFSGGLTYDKAGRSPSISVMHNKTTTVLEMEHNVVDFVTLCESPYICEMQEPYAIVVLLHNDLVVIDLLTPGFPCFENPYPMDIHESPVTCCVYLADCPSDLIPAFYSVGARGASKRTGFSEKEWPLSGGEWSPTSCSYYEVILTGHADGSVKFWDASAGNLQVLYKLKTAKVFEKPRTRSVEDIDDDPFAVQLISLCPESRKLAVVGASSYVIIFKFRKLESPSETSILEIPLACESLLDLGDSEISPDFEFASSRTSSIVKTDFTDVTNSCTERKGDYNLPVKVRNGIQKKAPGFQAHLVCLNLAPTGEQSVNITALILNSSYDLIAYGTETSVVIVDILQKACVLNIATPDLYGASDPYQRVPRSPKRTNPESEGPPSERCRSPISDQVVDKDCDTEEDSTSSDIEVPEVGEEALASLTLQNHDEEEIEKSVITPEPELETDGAPRPKPAGKWKGFSFKKQLSRVDLNLKNTLSNMNNNHVNKTATESDTEHNVPESPVVEEVANSEASNEPAKKCTRPTQLELFDRTPKKRVSLIEKNQAQPTARDTRLLSVPNISFRKPRHARNSQFTNLIRKLNKLDSSFSRSRSSSMSSLENISDESIHCLVFAESYTKKTENSNSFPTLWIGTSLGSVLTVILSVPSYGEARQSQPITASVSPSGTVFRLKGSIMTLSFLDCNGALIPSTYEVWRDEGREKQKTPTKSSPSSRMSPPPGSTETYNSNSCDKQFVVAISEKQARVVALPSQNCIYRQQLTENDFIVKAEIIHLKDSVCVVCYLSNGHITAHSLPSLRLLIDLEFLPLADLSFQTRKQGIVDPMLSIWGQQMFVNEDTDKIARTFCFSNRGHGLYLCSPSEVQKFTVSAEFSLSLSEMVGELFLPHEMPELPKQSFFQGLFGGGPRNLDREELFGEVSSGKPSRSVAKHIPGPNAQLDALNQRATTASSEVARAHQLMLERGEKLGQLEERTERMRNEAENFSSTAHQLMLKQKEKDKKWYYF
uniref:Syntaxin-binding protein 5-like n=2 Tax=Cacopsylla melanoneura TaxID=428564 RepID=A0A8D8ZUQ5_9HEMI